jgi:predicted DNA-binding mobile mystery protein A
MTAAQLGSRMGISQVAVTQLEQREMEGTISVESLQRAARAMDATAHCVFVPNSTLEDTVLRRAREVANRDLEGVDHSMRLEDQAVEQRATKRLLREHIADVLDSRRLWAEDR